MRACNRLPLLLVAALAVACSGVSVQQQVDPQLATLRQAGYRIAVMPFSVSAPPDGFVTESLGPVGELLALEGSGELPMHERLGTVLRADVMAWLQQSDYEVVSPWHVDTQLGHAGIDAAAARDPARANAIGKLLDVDALVYGDVRRWNRSYYVLQSVVEVALQVELIDAASGKRLFRTDRQEQIGSGITGGPTGYTSAATEPLAGLRGSHLRDLTRSVARHVAEDLNGGGLGNQEGAMAPTLAVVALAREHDGAFRLGERVDIVAVGSADCDVRFDLGRLRTDVPAVQTERHEDPKGERATYLGHYVVAAADVAAGLPLLCTIRKGATRRTVATHYRSDGTIDLDGRAVQ